MKKSLLILVAVIYFGGYTIVGCRNQQQKVNEDGFYVIDLVQCLESEQPLLASEIFDTVEYVILQTPRDIIISGIRQIVPYKEFLFVIARGQTAGRAGQAYQFSTDGQFVRTIGTRGQGPGEYLSANTIFVDEYKNEIIIGGTTHLLFYSMDGVFLRSQNLRCSNCAISDSLLWIAYYPAPDQKFQAISYTADGDTVSNIPNSSFGLNSSNYNMVGSEIFTPFYFRNWSTFFKGFESNDTIWKLSGSMAEPYAYFNMGRYKLPSEYEAWTSQFQYAKGYLGISVIFETDKFFFFRTQSRGMEKHPMYHFTHLAYDKENRSGFIIKDEKGIGITDDILGGIHIKPLWSTDEYLISVYEGLELLEDIKLGNFSPIPAFQKQLSTITEDTNQLIVFCHKKRNNQQ